MKKVRAQELMRDFIRSRQNAALGWPSLDVYNAEDIEYFRMLERGRLAGKIEIQGSILVLP